MSHHYLNKIDINYIPKNLLCQLVKHEIGICRDLLFLIRKSLKEKRPYLSGCRPGLKWLANRNNTSPTQASRAVRKLSRLGIIGKFQPRTAVGEYRTNCYWLGKALKTSIKTVLNWWRDRGKPKKPARLRNMTTIDTKNPRVENFKRLRHSDFLQMKLFLDSKAKYRV